MAGNNVYRFLVEDEIYPILSDRIPIGSLLNLLITNIDSMRVQYMKDDNGIIFEVSGIAKEAFVPVVNYLNHGIYPPEEALYLFDYLGVPLFDNYELSSLQEIEMRNNMYLPEFKEHSMNTDPHFNLVKIDQQLWESLRIVRPDDKNLLFNEKSIVKQSWYNIQAKLIELKRIIDLSPNYFIAGGCIFSALLGTESNDIDIFLHSCTASEAERLLFKFNEEISKRLANRRAYNQIIVTRTKNAVTFTVHNYITREYQFILRIYQTPSEILHGFDVDSCCFGYDGTNIWATQRALYAITHGYNTVNFDRLSPSYEYRLIKYGTRGMAIKVPNFSRDKVNVQELQGRWERFLQRGTNWAGMPYGNMSSRYDKIKTTKLSPPSAQQARYVKDTVLQGLDKILYLEYHCHSYNYHKRTLQTVGRLADESSDYCPVPYHYGPDGKDISSIIEYLIGSSDRHVESAAKYLFYLNSEFTKDERIASDFRTNNIPVAKEISFVKVQLKKQYNAYIVEVLFNIPDKIYHGLGTVRPWTIPQHIEFKITNPGEQMTGTFHRTILEDHQLWYRGKYYKY